MADKMIEKLNELHAEFKGAIERNDTAATDRLNTAISGIENQIKSLETAMGRPSGAGANDNDVEMKAFDSYLRSGTVTPELKAMSAVVNSEGGYTVPKVIDAEIRKLIVNISPMRSVARVVSVSTPDFRIPVSLGGTGSSWVGEKAARPETAAPTITEVVPSFGELYASPFVTQTILEDSQFDIAGHVSSEVAIEFARAEGAAFISGDGTNKPKGLLNPTTALTGDATRAFGTVQHVLSGTVGSISFEGLVNLTQSLKAGYRAAGKFIMSKDTLGVIRQLKDTTGQFLWQPSLQAGMPSTLLGYEVVEMEDMPAVANNALAVAFGDFTRAYTIADRVGVSMLVNPYSNAPYVAYQSRMRVGGAVVDTQAYKLLKIQAA